MEALAGAPAAEIGAIEVAWSISIGSEEGWIGTEVKTEKVGTVLAVDAAAAPLVTKAPELAAAPVADFVVVESGGR